MNTNNCSNFICCYLQACSLVNNFQPLLNKTLIPDWWNINYQSVIALQVLDPAASFRRVSTVSCGDFRMLTLWFDREHSLFLPIYWWGLRLFNIIFGCEQKHRCNELVVIYSTDRREVPPTSRKWGSITLNVRSISGYAAKISPEIKM